MAAFVSLALLVAVAAYAFHISHKLDVGQEVFNHQPGSSCRHVRGPVGGSEGIELIPSRGLAFITNGLKFPASPSPPPGKIYLYDFNSKSGEATDLRIEGAPFRLTDFHPHGLTHWMVDGVIRLYVIRHDNNDDSSIEAFDYDESLKTLVYNKTIKHETMFAPNDVAAVGVDEIVFANDRYGKNFAWSAVEFLTGFQGGSVYFTDGEVSHKLVTGKGYSNGLAFDPSGNRLFLANTIEETVEAYKLGEDRKSVELLSSTRVSSGVDNVYFDANDRSLYVGSHPVNHKLVRALLKCGAKNNDVLSPSQVLRLRYNDDFKKATTTESYSNDGSELSASSAAVVFRNQMLIGTVCDRLLLCEISD